MRLSPLAEQIVAGIVVVAVGGLATLIWKSAPQVWDRLRARLSKGRFLLTSAVQNQLMDGWGESNLIQLGHGVPQLPPQSKMFVEIETPDEKRVWSTEVPLGYKMSDLALAARSYFKLEPAFFRLTNKARQAQPLPDDQIESAAQVGDRLKLIECQGVWGWGSGSKRGWFHALADRILGVKVIRRLGAGGDQS